MKPSLRELDLGEFGDWPLAYRAAVCVLLMLLAAALPWLLLTRPILAEWQSLVAAESELQTRLAQTRQRVNTLPAFPQSMLEQAPIPNLPELVTAIAEAAQTDGLHGGQFRPKSPVQPDANSAGETRSSIELRLHGSWQQLAAFAAHLAAPSWNVILSLRDVRLRAQTATTTPLLELSGILLVYPHFVAGSVPLSEQPTNEDNRPGRNPFADVSTRSHRSPQTVVGALSNEQGWVGLVLTPDGQLRPVMPRRK